MENGKKRLSRGLNDIPRDRLVVVQAFRNELLLKNDFLPVTSDDFVQ